jgi:proline dehydrogenase
MMKVGPDQGAAMMRDLLLTLSRQAWLRDWMEDSSTAERFTSRFVAGRTLDHALKVSYKLQGEGILATLDHLGENVTSIEESYQSRDAYLKALTGIADQHLVGTTISVKLTQLGLDISEDHCKENISALAARALQHHTRVEVDMESSEYVDRTLAIVRDLHTRYGNVRAVIQSYLYRSDMDVERLSRDRIPVRLCKGAYSEPESVAYPAKADVDSSYARLMKRLLADGVDPAIATHDEKLVRRALKDAHELGLSSQAFEFQMLYGIRRDLQRELVRRGCRLRLYVPYGDAWYPYFMRRLAERPANLWFIVRNLLRA